MIRTPQTFVTKSLGIVKRNIEKKHTTIDGIYRPPCIILLCMQTKHLTLVMVKLILRCPCGFCCAPLLYATIGIFGSAKKCANGGPVSAQFQKSSRFLSQQLSFWENEYFNYRTTQTTSVEGKIVSLAFLRIILKDNKVLVM